MLPLLEVGHSTILIAYLARAPGDSGGTLRSIRFHRFSPSLRPFLVGVLARESSPEGLSEATTSRVRAYEPDDLMRGVLLCQWARWAEDRPFAQLSRLLRSRISFSYSDR